MFSLENFGKFSEQVILSRKLNVLRNPKATRKKQYTEHLTELIFNITKTMNDFLLDFFGVFSQTNESDK